MRFHVWRILFSSVISRSHSRTDVHKEVMLLKLALGKLGRFNRVVLYEQSSCGQIRMSSYHIRKIGMICDPCRTKIESLMLSPCEGLL